MTESRAGLPSSSFALPVPGVLVPLVTPLLPDRSPDLESLVSLIDFVLDHGVHGLLVLGSSGECAALPAAHRDVVAGAAISSARGRAHVMVGVSTAGTIDAKAEAKRLAGMGADSLLVAAPAGMRLAPAELERHFRALADCGAPVVAYDVPARVGVALEPQSVARLAREGAIAGIKDSTVELPKAMRYVAALRDVPGFVTYTGCEECIDASLLAGYSGAIPGLANVFPQLPAALVAAAARGDWAQASTLQAAVIELLELYSYSLPGGSFLAQFFGTVKTALVELGVIAHATASAIFIQPDQGLREHVVRLLARSREFEAVGAR